MPSPTFGPLEINAPPRSEGANFSKTLQRSLGAFSCTSSTEHCKNNFGPCRTFKGANRCAMEWDIWVIVRALVRPVHSVIEFGARYGTSSCVLADATGNSGQVVSVEPDASVYEALAHNREMHKCNFHIVKGTVASTALQHAGVGKAHSSYAFTTSAAGVRNTNGKVLPNLGLHDVERATGLKFDVAVVDCEGCLDHVLGDGKGGAGALVDQLDLIIIELDGGPVHAQMYQRWSNSFHTRGFMRVWVSQDTMDPFAAWSKNLYYNAWQRIKPLPRADGKLPLPRYNRSTCSETFHRLKYHPFELRCQSRKGY